MKISVVLPTNRVTTSAAARVAELASLDPDRFEVVVRDNSQNAEKRVILENIKSPALRLHFAENHGAYENILEALRLATGEFVFLMGDDDWLSSHGARHLHRIAASIESDNTVVGINGVYLLDASVGTGVFDYQNLDSPEAIDRLKGFFGANGPNMLYFLVARRHLAEFCFEFIGRLPYRFSYHDWLISLMYLALGRLLKLKRIFFTYDLSEWESDEKAIAKDRAFYATAGLPREYDRLHWLFCALEGAMLLNSRLLSERARYDKQQMIDAWFRVMFTSFRNSNREMGLEDNAVNDATRKLRDKWVGQVELNLNELLLDVTSALEVADPEGAARFFNFWSTL